MKNSIIIFAASFLFIFTINSCIKSKFEEEIKEVKNSVSSSYDGSESFIDMKVSDNFDFKTSKKTTISVIDHYDTSGKLTVYGVDKHDEKQLFGKYTVNGNSSIDLEIPGHITGLIGILHRSDGTMSATRIKLAETQSLTFTSNKSQSRIGSSSPDCNSGCDNTITQTSGSINIPNNQTYCIPSGVEFTGGIGFGTNSTLKVCGTVNITWMSENWQQSHIIITETGEWNSSNSSLVINQANSSITNYGVINALAFSGKGILTNHGTIHFYHSNMSINQSAVVTNYGTLNVNNGSLNLNNNGNLINYCTVYSKLNFDANGTLSNYGQITCDQTTHFNNGGSHTLHSDSRVITQNVNIYGAVLGPASGSYARIDVASNTDIGNSGSIQNNVDFCDANGIEQNLGTFDVTVTQCEATIPSSGCVSGVTGTTPATGSVQYYPGENVFGSYVYEDLWPSYGDFDFNDLVIDYNYEFELNASNQVTSITAQFKIKAISAYNNGFMIVLPVSSGDVSSVNGSEITGSILTLNGNGTESGHIDAVIPIYDKINDYAGTGSVNIVVGGHSKDIPTSTITITFSNPVSLFTADDIVPFIYADEVRGHEIHFSDQLGTDLMSTNLYATYDSKSVTEPFKSPTNLSFAFNTPVSFDYPSENSLITDAYLNFATWAQTDGLSYQDWYTDDIGNRDESKIYQ